MIFKLKINRAACPKNGVVNIVELQTFKKRINENYPFVKCKTIGYTHCKREINAFTVGNEYESVLYVGGTHGMEFITSRLLMRYFIRLCEHYKNCKKLNGYLIRSFLSNRGLTVVPCLNPDGAAICRIGANSAGELSEFVNRASMGDTVHWQANAVGVDINHNFNAEWDDVRKREREAGIFRPCPSKFGGDYPESEPETKAITDYCRTHNIRHALSFHSQGEEIYYTFGSKTPFRCYQLAEIMQSLTDYTLSEPTGTAVGGGFKDWVISELNKPAFTIEVGMGTNPLPDSDLDAIYDRLEEMLTTMAIV